MNRWAVQEFDFIVCATCISWKLRPPRKEKRSTLASGLIVVTLIGKYFQNSASDVCQNIFEKKRQTFFRVKRSKFLPRCKPQRKNSARLPFCAKWRRNFFFDIERDMTADKFALRVRRPRYLHIALRLTSQKEKKTQKSANEIALHLCGVKHMERFSVSFSIAGAIRLTIFACATLAVCRSSSSTRS